MDTLTSIEKRKKINSFLIHIGLFIVTFITTTLAGVEWTTGQLPPYEFSLLIKGLPYSVSIMLIITFHEFGHYFAARYHRVKATLPFYIPYPTIPYFINFGTMGAVIRTKSPIYTKKAMFDIGIAGPISGFIVCLGILIYGFTHVPSIEYLLQIHPDYFSSEFGNDGYKLVFGDSILFSSLRYLLVDHNNFFPPMSEIYRYPYLCAGWFGLLVTSMNMIPVGQLDGGHIAYTMFGQKNHLKISSISTIILAVIGFAGVVDSLLEFNLDIGWSGWLLWAFILYFIVKLKHPPLPDVTTLDRKRILLGYISFIIFVISFSPTPLILKII
ncbi:MAG: site-2 protease family protein [Ignavibacterium sp.]|nr:site-2 protease family protein [Ignavibacterium sp.]